MKTSWNDAQAIADYVLVTGSGEDRTLFEARLILEPELKDSLQSQRAAYNVAAEYGRVKLREEITQVAFELFTAKKHSGFRRMIFSIFNK